MIVADALTAEWWGGIDPQTFALELASINASTIHLRINSPGGDVFAARAMEQALKEHPAKIVTHIDGVAASAATYIALAGDEVRMADGAMFMIHNAWTYAAGDKNDLTKTATLLAKIDGTLAKTYADATGKDVKEIAKLMDAETWFTAQGGAGLRLCRHDRQRRPAAVRQQSRHLEHGDLSQCAETCDRPHRSGCGAREHPETCTGTRPACRAERVRSGGTPPPTGVGSSRHLTHTPEHP